LTDPELQGIATQALNMAKFEIEKTRCLNGLIASYYADQGLKRMKKVEALIVNKFGKEWLNDWAKKKSVLRMVATLSGAPDAMVLVTSVNRFLPTPALEALPPDEKKAILVSSHERHHQAVKEGLLCIEDCLMANAQTPERVCLATLPTKPDSVVDYSFIPQSHFGGIMKFWGEDTITDAARRK